ncbi:MAG: hypothetical protein AB3N14_16330 [Flavobacteriaceae bacterium]
MRQIVFLVSLLVLLSACSTDSENNDQQASSCDRLLEVSQSKFDAASVDEFEVTSASIDGDCLSLQISYEGGCNEPTIQLIGSATVEAGSPPIRTLRIKVDTKGDSCTDLTSATLTFDLSALQLDLENRFELKIKGWNQSLIYTY